ncbi:type II toxin-antitoxin system Phd/YefM family antitoxin [Adlercreutzia murintestinalis]|jgi:prevent-host-death family protein|uniref:type II toxin-antitoxin system Phd/YefM family antitoxin n=1 Tax=Adlercreutzia murintestinalis TaxID=2941325 RepID=UPI00203F1DBD|nr:type II toxin-antitoxin system Phd/YefM family antitoxin [Adlercreutzia murintestinalis]
MTPALMELPVIRPITDLRTNLNDVCAQATETQEPVVLTKNGVASYVLMDSNAYDAAAQRNRVYLALKEAEIEEKYHPEPISGEEVRARMDELFRLIGIEYA